MINPLRADPTRTTLLRNKFAAEAVRRFNTLKAKINQLLIGEDSLGLTSNYLKPHVKYGYDKNRDHAVDRGYTYQWHKARKEYFKLKPWCVQCAKEGKKVRATNLDHIKKHSGNQTIFWDKGNWQGLCHSCHSKKTRTNNEQVENFDPNQPRDDQGQWTDSGGLTSHEVRAVKRYFRAYAGINRSVRKNLFDDDDIYLIDSAINKSIVPYSKTVYRGLRLPDLSIIYPGSVISDSSFASTSDKPEIADRFSWAGTVKKPVGYRVRLAIWVPAGSKGLDTIGMDEALGYESETLLPRYSAIEITDVRQQISSKYGPEDPVTVADGQLLQWPTDNELTFNESWQFHTQPQQVELFRQWLKQQLSHVIKDQHDDNDWWNEYILQGYARGAGRAFADTKRSGKLGSFYRGTQEEFLQSTFAQPVSTDKLKLLTGRVFTDLRGITDTLSQQITRVLADGLVMGKSPREIAVDMNDRVDKIGATRSAALARTEIIRAHAEGQLDAFERMGVEELGVAVEWSTSGLPNVCPKCKSLQGIVLKTSESHGLLPRHPNCRCSWIPSGVGEDTSGQIKTKARIQAAIRLSVGKDKKDKWAGKDLEVSKARPEALV